eukprot:6554877-Pyramimonas_sp.AAC.1
MRAGQDTENTNSEAVQRQRSWKIKAAGLCSEAVNEVCYLHIYVHKSTTPDNKFSDAASSAW